MTDCIRDIAKLPNPELAREIYETMMLDNFYGPAVDSIKKTCGAEYEIILRSYCLKAGLSFKDEDQMREEGYDKTPDMKLKVPVMISGRVVNWIESKASFGDPITHQQYTTDQFLPYKNRFGPGLVIYWFGFIDELTESTERGIVLLDHFPDKGEIVRLEDVLKEEFTSKSQPATHNLLKTWEHESKTIPNDSKHVQYDSNDDHNISKTVSPSSWLPVSSSTVGSIKRKPRATQTCSKPFQLFLGEVELEEDSLDEELVSMFKRTGLNEKEDSFHNYVDPMFDSDDDLYDTQFQGK